MKTFQRFLGIFLVVAASAGLLVACGGDDEECLDDNDCAADQLCNFETGQCAFDCTGAPDECLADETCVERENADGAICLQVDGGEECTVNEDCADDEVCENQVCVPEDGGEECTVNEDCADDEFCNTDTNQCEPFEETTYQFMRLQDVTDETTEACTNPSNADPGADIYGVQLTKQDGSQYWARVFVNGIITEDESGNLNQHTDVDNILDGNPPDLTNDCPEGFGSSGDYVAALGCGGELILEFVDDEEQRQQIEDGDEITVFEYGPTCGGSAEDEYQVEVCSDSPGNIDVGSCEGFVLGAGAETGVVDLTVEVPEGN